MILRKDYFRYFQMSVIQVMLKIVPKIKRKIKNVYISLLLKEKDS